MRSSGLSGDSRNTARVRSSIAASSAPISCMSTKRVSSPYFGSTSLKKRSVPEYTIRDEM